MAARRGIALAAAAVVVLVVGFIVVHALRGSSSTPAAATTAPLAAPRPLRIIFPEGFTRRQMAERISAVRAIAVRKRHVKPVLSAPQYLAATARSKLPARFARDAKPRPLEGFPFPATYDFDATTTSQQLVA
ncbi:MAG: hypothetical protein ACR2MU_03830, partial [Gaiellaceae bacterium]